MMARTYATPTAFRQALERRLSDIAQKEGTDIQRLRRQLAFDRRATHPVPEEFPSPPMSWTNPFAALAEECGSDPSIDKAVDQLARFYAALA